MRSCRSRGRCPTGSWSASVVSLLHGRARLGAVGSAGGGQLGGLALGDGLAAFRFAAGAGGPASLRPAGGGRQGRNAELGSTPVHGPEGLGVEARQGVSR